MLLYNAQIKTLFKGIPMQCIIFRMADWEQTLEQLLEIIFKDNKLKQ